MEYSSGEKKVAAVAFLFKDHPLQSQDLSLPRCRKGSCTDEQGVPDKTHLKGKKYEMTAGTSDPGRTQRHCPSM